MSCRRLRMRWCNRLADRSAVCMAAWWRLRVCRLVLRIILLRGFVLERAQKIVPALRAGLVVCGGLACAAACVQLGGCVAVVVGVRLTLGSMAAAGMQRCCWS